MLTSIGPTKPLVIIPTYNESENILSLMDAVQIALPSTDILVVDDNSPDGTGKIVAKRITEDRQSFLLKRAIKDGLGTAYIAGFEWALEREYTHIFQMDADFSHNPIYLPILLEKTSDYDLAIGSRWISNGQIEGWPLSRKLLSRAANFYARTILNTNIRDLTGGFRCFRREVVENIITHGVSSVGYGFLIEITWIALSFGHTAQEVPIMFRDRIFGESKLSSATFFEALGLVWRLRYRKINKTV